MSLFIGSIVIHVADIQRASRFWTAALGYEVREDEDEEDFEGEELDFEEDLDFQVLTDPARRWANISLQLSTEAKVGRNRLHLDLYSDDQEAEVERLEELGAVRLEWDYDPEDDFIVMADPDGNEFCVIDSEYSQD